MLINCLTEWMLNPDRVVSYDAEQYKAYSMDSIN
jgi:hypothetical protein